MEEKPAPSVCALKECTHPGPFLFPVVTMYHVKAKTPCKISPEIPCCPVHQRDEGVIADMKRIALDIMKKAKLAEPQRVTITWTEKWMSET